MAAGGAAEVLAAIQLRCPLAGRGCRVLGSAGKKEAARGAAGASLGPGPGSGAAAVAVAAAAAWRSCGSSLRVGCAVQQVGCHPTQVPAWVPPTCLVRSWLRLYCGGAAGQQGRGVVLKLPVVQ